MLQLLVLCLSAAITLRIAIQSPSRPLCRKRTSTTHLVSSIHEHVEAHNNLPLNKHKRTRHGTSTNQLVLANVCAKQSILLPLSCMRGGSKQAPSRGAAEHRQAESRMFGATTDFAALLAKQAENLERISRDDHEGPRAEETWLEQMERPHVLHRRPLRNMRLDQHEIGVLYQPSD